MKEPAESVNNTREVEYEIEQLTWETPNRLRDEPEPLPEDLSFIECRNGHGTFRGTRCPLCPK
jgi:hypothetical protein